MKILEPIQVGKITLKNRIMFPPLTTGYEDRNGSITPQSRAFYERLAKGGTGYIVIGDVNPIRSFSPTPRLYEDSQIESFKELADSVHKYGAKIALQIFHPEYDVDALFDLFAKKDMQGVRAKMHHDMQHFTDEVTEEKLMEIIDAMVQCAKRAQKAGIDFIQIHGDRLTGTLCSPKFNHRTDKFGGSLENRCRFARMLTRAIREAVPDMGLDYKFSLYTPQRGNGGVNIEEGVQFAKWLEEDGVDMLHVAQANHTTNMADTIPPMGVQPYGFFMDYTAIIKNAVNIPISCVGRIVDPYMAEGILETNKADIIGIGRPLLADADWGVKLAAGKPDTIRRCIFCNKGCTDAIQNRTAISCILNAENGHELERHIIKSDTPKNVAIIGAGPAGMEAARVAALRGHKVTLWEKEPILGGQLNLAAVPPRKEELLRSQADLAKAIYALDVDVRLGHTPNQAEILSEKPDSVLVAVGASCFTPPIAGTDKAHVSDAWQILRKERIVYGTVAIIGGGLVGCETAEYLAQQGCRVTIIEMLDKIASGESETVLPTMQEDFNNHNVIVHTKTKVISMDEKEVLCQDAEGKEVHIPADFIVMAIGARPNKFDTSEIEKAGIKVTMIGDCQEVSDISHAIRAGYDAACAIE